MRNNGRAIWAALRQPSPTELQSIAQTGTPALPLAAGALWRHLQELPGAADGLSLTQRIVLTILAEDGPTHIGRIFAAMVNGREPLVFMGDLGVLGTIDKMALTDPPVLTIEPGVKSFPRVASITEVGTKVLSGAMDYLALQPAERWVGGVVVDGTWRWDEQLGKVVSP